MDPKLAEIYGTNQATDADLEKLAAAELAEGLANDEQLDTDGLSEEELEAVAQEVLGSDEDDQDDGQEKVSEAEEAQEKLAEADYLGRVMAHSYVNELREIEKEAEVTSEKRKAILAKRKAEGAAGAELRAAQNKKLRAAHTEKLRGAAASRAMTPGQKASSLARSAGMKAKEVGGKVGKYISEHGGAKAMGLAKAHPKKAIGAGLLAAGGIGAAVGRKTKQSSALDTLVEARAMEILEASGIDPNELMEVEGQEKVSDPREALAGAVEERAWALLGQYGVVPSEEGDEE